MLEMGTVTKTPCPDVGGGEVECQWFKDAKIL